MAQDIKDKIMGLFESDGTGNPGVSSTLGLAVDSGKRSNHPEAFYPTSKPWTPQGTADTTPKPSLHEQEAVGATPPSGTGSSYVEQPGGLTGKPVSNPPGTEKGANFETTEGGAADKYLGTGESGEKAAGSLSQTEKGANFETTEGGELEKYV